MDRDTNSGANAIEHRGDDVTVTIGDLTDGLSVADDGPGIPNDGPEQVFEAGDTRAEAGTIQVEYRQRDRRSPRPVGSHD